MIKIAIIVPKDTVNIAKLAAEQFEEQITVLLGSMDEGVGIAKQLVKDDYDVIIARGGTFTLLKQSNISIPIISIPIVPIDIFEVINEAEKLDDDISLILTKNMRRACESYELISGRTLNTFQIEVELEVEQIIKKLASEGKKVIVGPGIITKYAPLYGLNPVVIKSGKEAIVSSIEEAKRIAIATRKEKKNNEKIKAVIEHSSEGIISVDNKGDINIFNTSALKLLKYHSSEVIGKNINNILPELEIADTLLDSVKETEIIKKLRGVKFIVSKIPIIVNNEIIDILIILRDINEIQEMEEKIRQDIATTGHYAKYTFDDVIGKSEATKETIRIGKEYAKVDSTILIEGETGTGKEVIAQSIHNYSNRSNRPFVAVNCAALPETLLESELFGYAPGAFTGADRKGKRGLFELAHGGTIFLDEISEMNPLLQGRLLRVIQEKQVMKIGDNKIIPINARVIAATNQKLGNLVNTGEFREDLFYRLNVLRMVLVPLKDRKEDIICLLDYFVNFYCKKLGKRNLIMDSEVNQFLLECSWPGNVREIRNFCERLVVMSKKTNISLDDITNQILNIEFNHNGFNDSTNTTDKSKTYYQDTINLEDMEEINIKIALQSSNGKIINAAEELGISRTTLWRKMKKYDIIVP